MKKSPPGELLYLTFGGGMNDRRADPCPTEEQIVAALGDPSMRTDEAQRIKDHCATCLQCQLSSVRGHILARKEVIWMGNLKASL